MAKKKDQDQSQEQDQEEKPEVRCFSVAPTQLKASQVRKKDKAWAVFAFIWVQYLWNGLLSRIMVRQLHGLDEEGNEVIDPETEDILRDKKARVPRHCYPYSILVPTECLPFHGSPMVVYRGLFECSMTIEKLIEEYEKWVEWPDHKLPHKVAENMLRDKMKAGIQVHLPAPTSDTTISFLTHAQKVLDTVRKDRNGCPIDELTQSPSGELLVPPRPKKQLNTAFECHPGSPSAESSKENGGGGRGDGKAKYNGGEVKDPEQKHTPWFSPCYFFSHTNCDKIYGSKIFRPQGMRIMLCARKSGPLKSSKGAPEIAWKLRTLLSAEIIPEAQNMRTYYEYARFWANMEGYHMKTIVKMSGVDAVKYRILSDLPNAFWVTKEESLRNYCTAVFPAVMDSPLLLWLSLYYKPAALLCLTQRQLETMAALMRRFPLLPAFPDMFFDYIELATGGASPQLLSPLIRRRLGMLGMDQLQQLCRSTEMYDPRLPFDFKRDGGIIDAYSMARFATDYFVLQCHDPVPPPKKKKKERKRQPKKTPTPPPPSVPALPPKKAKAFDAKKAELLASLPPEKRAELEALFGLLNPTGAPEKQAIVEELLEEEEDDEDDSSSDSSDSEDEDEDEEEEDEDEEEEEEEQPKKKEKQKQVSFKDDEAEEDEETDDTAFDPADRAELYFTPGDGTMGDADGSREIFTEGMIQVYHGFVERLWGQGHTSCLYGVNAIATDEDQELAAVYGNVLQERDLLVPDPLIPTNNMLSQSAFMEHQLAQMMFETLPQAMHRHSDGIPRLELLYYSHPAVGWCKMIHDWGSLHFEGEVDEKTYRERWRENIVIVPDNSWTQFVKDRCTVRPNTVTWKDFPDYLIGINDDSPKPRTIVIWEAQIYGVRELLYLYECILKAVTNYDQLKSLQEVVLAGCPWGSRPVNYMGYGCPFQSLYHQRRLFDGHQLKVWSLVSDHERGNCTPMEAQLSSAELSGFTVKSSVMNTLRCCHATLSRNPTPYTDWKSGVTHDPYAAFEDQAPHMSLLCIKDRKELGAVLDSFRQAMLEDHKTKTSTAIFHCGRYSHNCQQILFKEAKIPEQISPRGVFIEGAVLNLADTSEVVRVKKIYKVLNLCHRQDPNKILRLQSISDVGTTGDPLIVFEAKPLKNWVFDQEMHSGDCCRLGVAYTDAKGANYTYESILIDGRPADKSLLKRLIFPSRHEVRTGLIFSPLDYCGAPVNTGIVVVNPGTTWNEIYRATRMVMGSLVFLFMQDNGSLMLPGNDQYLQNTLRSMLKTPYKGRYIKSQFHYFALALINGCLDKDVYNYDAEKNQDVFDPKLAQLFGVRLPEAESTEKQAIRLYKRAAVPDDDDDEDKTKDDETVSEPDQIDLDEVVILPNGVVVPADEPSAAKDREGDGDDDDDDDELSSDDEDFIDDGDEEGEDIGNESDE